jgi:hypothetical protein
MKINKTNSLCSHLVPNRSEKHGVPDMTKPEVLDEEADFSLILSGAAVSIRRLFGKVTHFQRVAYKALYPIVT